MNDPIGDMLTRIRNARCAANPLWRHRLPSCVLGLDVLADEGYIRGYERTTGKDGHPAIEISLKYYEGDSCHSRSEAGLQAWPSRLHGCQ